MILCNFQKCRSCLKPYAYMYKMIFLCLMSKSPFDGWGWGQHLSFHKVKCISNVFPNKQSRKQVLCPIESVTKQTWLDLKSWCLPTKAKTDHRLPVRICWTPFCNMFHLTTYMIQGRYQHAVWLSVLLAFVTGWHKYDFSI